MSALKNLLQEDLQPLEKINKLIELYISRISSNKGIYRILHFEFSSKKSYGVVHIPDGFSESLPEHHNQSAAISQVPVHGK